MAPLYPDHPMYDIYANIWLRRLEKQHWPIYGIHSQFLTTFKNLWNLWTSDNIREHCPINPTNLIPSCSHPDGSLALNSTMIVAHEDASLSYSPRKLKSWKWWSGTQVWQSIDATPRCASGIAVPSYALSTSSSSEFLTGSSFKSMQQWQNMETWGPCCPVEMTKVTFISKFATTKTQQEITTKYSAALHKDMVSPCLPQYLHQKKFRE